jgi:uroporphyrinogen-III synthase
MAILVTRAQGKFSDILRDAGLEVVDLELIRTEPLENLSDLKARLRSLSDYDGLFFTSSAAADVFVNERGKSNGFYGKVYALGRRTQEILSGTGLNVRPATANTADELLREFGDIEFAGKKLLFVRGERSLRTIPESLDEIAVVDEVSVYRTVSVEMESDKIATVKAKLVKDEIDLVCFFSPSGVERFVELFGRSAASARAAAIGTTTADAARAAGLILDFISPRSSAEEFARCMIEHTRQVRRSRPMGSSTNNE